MLNRIRKSADSVLMRMFLALIALSFIGIGGVSIFSNLNDTSNLVTFKHTNPISLNKFQVTASKSLETIRQETGKSLEENSETKMQLNYEVLQSLINESMLQYLAKIYNFAVSEQQVIATIKDAPNFKNEQNVFDLAKYKLYFQNSSLKEQEFTQNVQNSIVTHSLSKVFLESYIVPKVMINNITNYILEKRNFEIVEIDLKQSSKSFIPKNTDLVTLQAIYEEKKESFLQPEKRSFTYFVLSKEFFVKMIKPTEKELKKFFEENRTEFVQKNFNKAKQSIKNAFINSKIDEIISNVAKSLEDASSDKNIHELASQYGVKTIEIKEISKKDLLTGLMQPVADNVFQMDIGELSYPIETRDSNQIFMIELNSITPAKQSDISEVQGELLKIAKERDLLEHNLQNFIEIQKTYDGKKLSSNLAMRISKKSMNRDEINRQSEIDFNLAKALFDTNINSNTRIMRSAEKAYPEKAYFARVTSIIQNTSDITSLPDSTKKNIEDTIKGALLQELIGYLTEQNNMQINLEQLNR